MYIESITVAAHQFFFSDTGTVDLSGRWVGNIDKASKSLKSIQSQRVSKV